jgi:hypothetical protein
MPNIESCLTFRKLILKTGGKTTEIYTWIELFLLIVIGIGIFILIQRVEKIRIGKVKFEDEGKSKEDIKEDH